jgi:hypothetical protein
VVGDVVRREPDLEGCMSVDEWLKAAVADAERRGLPELKAVLEGLANAARALRDAGLGGRADGRTEH